MQGTQSSKTMSCRRSKAAPAPSGCSWCARAVVFGLGDPNPEEVLFVQAQFGGKPAYFRQLGRGYAQSDLIFTSHCYLLPALANLMDNRKQRAGYETCPPIILRTFV